MGVPVRSLTGTAFGVPVRIVRGVAFQVPVRALTGTTGTAYGVPVGEGHVRLLRAPPSEFP